MTTLCLDFDEGARLDETRLSFLLDVLGWNDAVIDRREIPTARGYHVVIELAGAHPPLMVVAMQAILGSDSRRETFNVLRASMLGDAPGFWRKGDRWNTLYSEKLGRVSRMTIRASEFGRDTFKVEDIGDSDVAVLTIRDVEQTEMDGKNKLILHFAETEKSYFVNFTGIKTLVGKLGEDEDKWKGKRVPLVRTKTRHAQTREPVEALWVADGAEWDELIAAAATGGRRRRGPAKRGAKRGGKKAR